ncbi:MAG: futalosine hydrolase [Desulfofustis sp.]|nr:futalosine hydrolase [Desulfofustis sp.]
MHLVVAATQTEMDAYRCIDQSTANQVHRLVSGVGPMESGITLSRFLERHHTKIRTVVNFGIGGAYYSGPNRQLELIDLCLAEREILGDFGVCYGDRVEPFAQDDFPAQSVFELDPHLLATARSALSAETIDSTVGTFVTVNGASGFRVRGDRFADRYGAICENMEGAAVARVCELFHLPLVEVRAISNQVEDRTEEVWPIAEAAARAAQAATLIIKRLQEVR